MAALAATGSPTQLPEILMASRSLQSLVPSISLVAALGAALASTTAFASGDPAANAAATEKCFGVAKAGQNGCAAGPGTSCAGSSKKDFAGNAWKQVPKGTCTTLVSAHSQTGHGQLLAFKEVSPGEKR